MPEKSLRALNFFLFVTITAGSAECQEGRPIDPELMRPNEAHITAATGQVSRIRDAQAWALSAGEQVPVRQIITTGRDGYARFEVAGGSSFELFSNSRIIFRQNTAMAGDLLDVVAGRVRVHLEPTAGQTQQRVFTPAAIITAAQQPASMAIAIDEDNTVRIDVMEGEVRVQHALRPRNDPTIVRAADAILIRPDEQISRRVDRGSLYRYTVKSLHDIWSSVWPGHTGPHDGDPIEQKLLAQR
ncbi:MAG TPA: FecR domain-containing protein [Bryobacteraceae bacterium]